MEQIADFLMDHMRYDTKQNYICPGLRSSMIALRPMGGCVRLFEAERRTDEYVITSHNHGYDFTALVLRGSVVNRVLSPRGYDNDGTPVDSRVYVRGYLSGDLGRYEIHRPAEDPTLLYLTDFTYEAGETYSMLHDDFHTITFGAGAKVLMFEGPRIHSTTMFLEPWVAGFGRVETFRVEPWMFQGVPT